ncbi:MAG: ISL3 family transposase [Fimbriimonas sp.]
MRETEFFGSLLGLTSEWSVASVELVEEAKSVRIWVEHSGVARCPVCGESCSVYDHSAERMWRHLDTMQFMTFVVCKVPRVNCPRDGVKQIEVPWAGPKSRFTAMFERVAIELLSLTRCQSRSARILRLSAGQVHDIMHRAVKRGLARRDVGAIHHVSLDEKSFHKGHVYGTVLVDVLGKRVLDVVFGRDESATRELLGSLPKPEEVKTVTIDMLQAYKNAVHAELPKAEVIHDRFHVAMNLNRAVDQVRRAEVKRQPALKGSRFVWLRNPETRSPSQNADFDYLMNLELRTSKAYALKQVFRHFFEQDDIDSAARFFQEWHQEVKAAELRPVSQVAKMLEVNIKGLLAYVKHKLTNGYAEAVNALIQEIKTVARGFRRFEGFQVAILFFLGKLELNPCKTS